jgi:hypothetical protein
MLDKYCAALDVSPLWLLYGEEENKDASGCMWLRAPLDADYRVIASEANNTVGGYINEGDLLYIKKATSLEKGKLALVEVDAVQMLAYWHYNAEHPSLCLTGLNAQAQPLIFIGDDINRVKLIGQVVFYLAEPRGFNDGNNT